MMLNLVFVFSCIFVPPLEDWTDSKSINGSLILQEINLLYLGWNKLTLLDYISFGLGQLTKDITQSIIFFFKQSTHNNDI